MIKQKLIEIFKIPEAGYEVIDCILNPKEQKFLLLMDSKKEYTHQELCEIALSERIFEQKMDAENFIDSMFHRGVISRGGDGISYCTATFYARLDIFATEEIEAYDALSRETKERLDHWYFEAYLEGVGSNNEPFPTEDEVLPLDEVLEFIENRDDTPYLAKCDCRRLIQNCDQSTDTCITYRTAPNSFVKRGQAIPITKEEAKAIVRKADRSGLIHTINPGGICNCCTDCCYLFRAAKARSSQGIWPRVHYVVKLDKDKCIDCGACMRRCRFSVFSNDEELRIEQISRCQGCGLCVTGCPTGALSLLKRN